MNSDEEEPIKPLSEPVWPEGAVGEYASLLRECADASVERGLIPVFVPSLAATLLNADKTGTNPLTERDAIAIRDRCPCIMLAPATAAAMEERRGYADMNPDNCWQEFLQLKDQLNEPESA